MKKFILLIAIVCVSLGSIAQKGKARLSLSYIDQGMLDKAKESLDQALTNEKSKDWPDTYFAKGELCQAVFKSENENFKSMYDDPLVEAYAAYEKAIELDTKGSMKKKIITSMAYTTLAANFFSQGSQRFLANDYEGALKSFENLIKVSESDRYIGAADTGMYFNAGLAALNSSKYDESIKYFQKCAEMKYNGIKPYINIYESYLGLGDTLKAESILMNLSEKFPDDNTVVLQLTDFYIKSNKNKEALKYIKVAKEGDPTNYYLYYVSGVLNMNLNNYDDAISELKKADELKADVFDVQYSLGGAYINKAADMYKAANDIMDVQEYNDAVDKANKVYAMALPYMERANEIKPNDIDTLRQLRELYYRLKLTDKYSATKAQIDSLENQ